MKKNRLLLWGGVFIGIIALVALLAIFGNNTPSSNTSGKNLSVSVSENDHIKGNSNARLTLVEYSDFQCPACGGVYPWLKQLTETFPDDLRIIYRHYPLRSIHPNAQLASEAAEAAHMQNAFWDMHDVIFNTQTGWSNLPDPTDFFVTLAESIGLDTEQFRDDLNSAAVKNIVNDSYASASGMRLNGTPSFFFNGTQIQNPGSYDGFKTLIETELAK